MRTGSPVSARVLPRSALVLFLACGGSEETKPTVTPTPTPDSSAIIVDHACTDLSRIPATAIADAKARLRIAYGHTSHGSQLITGMNALAANSLYSWNAGGTNGALKIHDGGLAGDVGYHPQWVNNTRAYLGTPDAATGRGTSHADINVILWSWCGQVSSRTQQDMISTYLAPMTQLETEYPGVKFVYMTGHLDGTGAQGNLNQRNEQIRAYCRANRKILFDFADIESYAPGGATNFMERLADDGCNYDSDANGTRDQNWASQWLAAHPSDPLAVAAKACGSCAHSETLNCIQKGRAAWWLWARLGGWSQ